MPSPAVPGLALQGDTAASSNRIARAAGVATILNPAPAAELDDDLLALCDCLYRLGEYSRVTRLLEVDGERAPLAGAATPVPVSMPAEAALSNKWRLQFSGAAESPGELVFEVTDSAGYEVYRQQVPATIAAPPRASTNRNAKTPRMIHSQVRLGLGGST